MVLVPSCRRVSPARRIAFGAAFAFAFAFATGGCWDFDYVDAPAGLDAAVDAPTRSDARVPCVEGGYYCGGEQVSGDPRSLYRCNKDGSSTLTATCATACIVAPPGKDDACSQAPACVTNGTYCGGDKVNGDPNVLYRCNAGSTISVVRRCPNGCQINKNDDDTCK